MLAAEVREEANAEVLDEAHRERQVLTVALAQQHAARVRLSLDPRWLLGLHAKARRRSVRLWAERRFALRRANGS